MDKNLYTQADFMNLTLDEVNEIKKLVDLNFPDDLDERVYLFNNINILESNETVNNKITNKILAGQVSVKWYKYRYDDNFTKDILKEKLQKPEHGYNLSILSRTDKIDTVSCVINHNNIYILKIFISDGYKTITNGINSYRQEQIRSIIVKIDIDNCWIEIRCPESKCNRIENIVSRDLGLVNITEVSILRKYSGDINSFKNSLENGRYLNWTAIPSEPLELTEDDKSALASIIKYIDDYLHDKDSVKLVESLDSMNYDTEDLSIIALLLAGVGSMGMGIKKNSDKDMSDQSLYTILKDYIIENKSYISFATHADGILYTMQVGLKSNNIVFRSSVTEDVIEYIRNKIF
ncbi:MAG: hypothetical protein K0R92_1532 [Lachnospiraceae bacterium]|jgi:hypothetical protein|nr:hypothetical protein [Lachnospiraceae bacterium]